MTFCCTAATQLVPMSYCPKTRTWPNADLPSSHVNSWTGIMPGPPLSWNRLTIGMPQQKHAGYWELTAQLPHGELTMLEACYERLNDENGIKQLYEYIRRSQ